MQFHPTFVAALSLIIVAGTFAEQPQQQAVVSQCPMVTESKKEGLFQLVETFDPKGNKFVGAPGEKLRIKCTIINLTERPLFVAEDYITPQDVSFNARKDTPKDYPESRYPESIPCNDATLGYGGLDVPKGRMDWGHIRRWISIAESHGDACDCCIRHRQYSKEIDVVLPKGEWKTVVLDLRQWMPVMFLEPEKRDFVASTLRLVINRRSEQAVPPNGP